MLTLYENVKKYRIMNGWSQEELAKKAGYTDRSSIAKIEKGLVDLPQKKIMQLAEIFNITPGELMGEDGVASESEFTPIVRSAARYMMEMSDEDQNFVMNFIKRMSEK